MMKLTLLRHGESLRNRRNRFSGWTDVDLSDHGRIEAQEAGKVDSGDDKFVVAIVRQQQEGGKENAK